MNNLISKHLFMALSLFATISSAESGGSIRVLSKTPEQKILIKNPPTTPYCSHPKWIQKVLSTPLALEESNLSNFVSQFMFHLDENRKNKWVNEEAFYEAIDDLKAPILVDRILVEKSKNRLHLLAQGKLIKSYFVSLGFSPIGHKAQEGDGKTPEGVYQIEYKNPNSAFYLALRVSYPNKFDEYFAKNHKVKPGGFIMVHGFPKDEDERKKVELVHGRVNWTEGCMGMTDSEIEEVFSLVPAGTPIEICR